MVGLRLLMRVLWRTIVASKGRFISIVLICMLGSGFYAGLTMTGANMRHELEVLSRVHNVPDVTLTSSMGFDVEEISYIASLKNVSALSAQKMTDEVFDTKNVSFVARVQMLPSSLNALEDEKTDVHIKQSQLIQSKEKPLNTPLLVEGQMPMHSDECVVGSLKQSPVDIELGDTITVSSKLNALAKDDAKAEEVGIQNDPLAVKSFTVVGKVRAPQYLSVFQLGSTNLGTGSLDQYVYVLPSAFQNSYPYSQIFLESKSNTGTNSQISNTSETFEKQYETIIPYLAFLRARVIKQDAQSKLNERQDEFYVKRREALDALSQAQQELETHETTLKNGYYELVQGESRLANETILLQEKKRKALQEFAEATSMFESKTHEIDEGYKRIGLSKAELLERQDQLQKAQEALIKLLDAQKLIQELIKELVTQKAITLDALTNEQDALDGEIANLEEKLVQLKSDVDRKTDLESKKAKLLEEYSLNPTSELEVQIQAIDVKLQALKDAETKLAHAQEKKNTLAQKRDTVAKSIEYVEVLFEASHVILLQQQEEVQAHLSKIGMTLEEVKAHLQEIEKGLDGITELDNARVQLEKAQQEFIIQKNDALAKFSQGLNVIRRARSELLDKKQELIVAQKRLQVGFEEYVSKSQTAHEELDRAQQKLSEAQDTINNLEKPDIAITSQQDVLAYRLYLNNAMSIDSISRIFPIMFFLVAALVSLTAMTRMIEEERTEVGVLKALGYGIGFCMGKYVFYGLLASSIGAVLGIAVFSQVLPRVLISAYAHAFAVEASQPLMLAPSCQVIGVAFALSTGVVLATSVGVLGKELLSKPSELIVPKAPLAGKKILLERTQLWTHLNFLWKVTLRNLFRYKRRLCMSVVGIAGCSALILVGFGLQDGITSIVGLQFKNPDAISKVMLSVALRDSVSTSNKLELEDTIKEMDPRAVIVPVQSQYMFVQKSQDHEQGDSDNALGSVEFGYKNETRQLIDPYVADVMVFEDFSQAPEVTTLREESTGKPVEPSDTTCVITAKLARLLNVKEGDSIEVSGISKVGSKLPKSQKLKVSNVVENYIKHALYIAEPAYTQDFGKKPSFNTYLISFSNTEDASEATEKLYKLLKESSLVQTVTKTQAFVESFEKSLESVHAVVVLMIMAAGGLSAVVLYNLITITIIERTREIASLKVLGMSKQEIASYVFREMLCSVVLGALVGLVLGVFLERWVLLAAETQELMFSTYVSPTSFAWAFGLTLIFAIVIMRLNRSKVLSIPMVESLKSVD